MIVDSNIIIYSAQPVHSDLRQFIEANRPAVSAVSIIEVLGFHRLQANDRDYFEEFFSAARVIPIDDVVVQRAMRLRQMKKMSIGDAIIAGTALIYSKTLATNNTADFTWITGLDVINPLASIGIV